MSRENLLDRNALTCAASRLGKQLHDAYEVLGIPRDDGQLFHPMRRAAPERMCHLLKKGKVDPLTAVNFMDHSMDIMREKYLGDDMPGTGASHRAHARRHVHAANARLATTAQRQNRTVGRAWIIWNCASGQ